MGHFVFKYGINPLDQLPLRVGFSAQRGYYLQLTLNNSTKAAPELPAECLQVCRQKKMVTFVTADLIRMNGFAACSWCDWHAELPPWTDRVHESVQEMFQLSSLFVDSACHETVTLSV